MKQKMRNSLTLFELSKKKMNDLRGAVVRVCCCACAYADSGGSSVEANDSANHNGGERGLQSPECAE